MPAPFGFSVGDIVAVVALISKVVGVLRDSGRATVEYLETIERLQSLAISTQDAWQALTSSSIVALIPDDHALMKGLRFHLDKCHQVLTKFLVSSLHLKIAQR